MSQDSPPTEAFHPETELRTMNAFVISLLQQTTFEDLLWSMAENIGTLMGYEDCLIYLLDGNQLVQAAAYGNHAPPDRRIDHPLVLALGEGIAGTVAETGVGMVVPDTRREPRYVADRFHGLSELTVPILFEGRVLGVIDSERKEANGFEQSDLDRLQRIANIAASRLASAQAARDRRKAEDALRQVHDELRAEKLESLGTLAGGIAHDFNNLLTVILGNINLAQCFVGQTGSRETTGARETKVLNAAHEACLRARDLTKQLLIFASGGAPIKKTATIHELIRDSVQFALHGSNVRAEFDVPKDLHAVEMDAGQIHAVFNSLVLNAVQAMPNGGVIHVRAENILSDEGANNTGGGQGVLVEVEDHGSGIAPAILEKIFDPYFTTKGKDGTGLGLSTAYKIVHEHGGRLSATSEEGQGATFRMRLPAANARTALQPEQVSATTNHQTVGHVLLMDDDESVRSSIAQMLSVLGHQVTVAGHGEEALQLFGDALRASQPFSAVILDLTIPGGMGGKEVIPRLRALDPEVKAIVASGYSTDPVMAAHESHGFQAVIEKPFDLNELDQVLSRLIA